MGLGDQSAMQSESTFSSSCYSLRNLTLKIDKAVAAKDEGYGKEYLQYKQINK